MTHPGASALAVLSPNLRLRSSMSRSSVEIWQGSITRTSLSTRDHSSTSIRTARIVVARASRCAANIDFRDRLLERILVELLLDLAPLVGQRVHLFLGVLHLILPRESREQQERHAHKWVNEAEAEVS